MEAAWVHAVHFLLFLLLKIKYTRNNKCGIDENTDFLKGVRRNEGYHKKQIAIGVEDFKEIIVKDGYFVDKT